MENDIFIYHLGANLTTVDAVNSYGKTDENGNITTTEFTDNVYIGYKGKREDNTLITSIWDGDFERDSQDGDVIWTLDTAGGDDLVQIRDEQNEYTVTKLGEGNDTFITGHSLEAAYFVAQQDSSARAYVFAEEGDDTIIIGGQVDGGRIFAGEGSDTITIHGEMDDGGVIDLGAGMVDYANGNIDAATSVDTFEHTNKLHVMGDLGESSTTDFGAVFGGDGKDIVIINHEIQGDSQIVLNNNNDEVTVAYMQDNSKILTVNDDDIVNVHGNMYHNSIVNTAGINTEDDVILVEEEFTFPDGRTITYIIEEFVEGRSDDDIVNIAKSMLNHSLVDVGPGFNQINIGDDVDDYATILAGDDKDILRVKDDLEDYSQVHLGHGNNEIYIESTIEDFSQLTTGSGDDFLSVGYAIANSSVVNLGDGNNEIHIGDDLDGCAQLITGSGNDLLIIKDDTEDHSIANLGDGNNTVLVTDRLEDNSQIITGDGNDIVSIGNNMINNSHVNVGSGDDTVSSTYGLCHDACANGGLGFDTFVFGSDTSQAYSANISNITNFEAVQLKGNTHLHVSLLDLFYDYSKNGLMISGNDDSCVQLQYLYSTNNSIQAEDGSVYNQYSYQYGSRSFDVYIQEDLTVL